MFTCSLPYRYKQSYFHILWICFLPRFWQSRSANRCCTASTLSQSLITGWKIPVSIESDHDLTNLRSFGTSDDALEYCFILRNDLIFDTLFWSNIYTHTCISCNIYALTCISCNIYTTSLNFFFQWFWKCVQRWFVSPSLQRLCWKWRNFSSLTWHCCATTTATIGELSCRCPSGRSAIVSLLKNGMSNWNVK